MDAPKFKPSDALILPYHTGYFMNPLYDKQGLEIQVRNGLVYVYWYNYGKDGHRSYNFGGGLDTANEFKLNTTFIAGGVKQEAVIGDCQLVFDDQDNGYFSFWDDVHGRNGFEIQRVTPYAEPHVNNGGYVHDDFDKEGHTVQILGDTCVCYWWKYTDTGQDWLICVGEYNIADGEYDLAIIEATGEFMRIGEGSEEVVGDAWITIIDDDTLEFQWELDDEPNTETLSRTITRSF